MQRPLLRAGLARRFGSDPARDVSIAVLRVVRAAAAAFVVLGLFIVASGGVFVGVAVFLAAVVVALVAHREMRLPNPRVHTALAVTGVVTVGVRFLGVLTEDAWSASTRGTDVVVVVAGFVAVVLTEKRVLEAIGFWLAVVVASVGMATTTTGAGVGVYVVDTAGAAIAFAAGGILSRLVRSALDDRQMRYRSIMDISPIGIVEVDLSGIVTWLDRVTSSGVEDLAAWLDDDDQRFADALGHARIVAVNGRALDLLGFPNEKALAGALRALPVRAAPAAAMREHLLGMWRGKMESRNEMQIVYPNGDSRTLLFAAGAHRVGAKPDPGKMVITLVDIEPQKRAERALHDQIQIRDRFVASVSHELRTPIAAVHGLAQELVDGPQEFSAVERDDLLRLIASQSADVASIVADLLVAARADAGAMIVRLETVDVSGVVRSVAAELALNGVSLEVDRGLIARADPVRLRQVVRNLLTNALRYGGPHVRVLAHNGGADVRVEVRDDGRPIPADAQDRMFLPYETTQTLLGRTDAVGLGLSVARTLARLMGGDLTYRWEGGESIFTVSVPVGDHEPEPVA